MRTTRLFFAFVWVCVLALPVLAQNGLKGSGTIVEKNYPVQSFDQLKIEGIFNVHLTQGNSESVRLTIDDNLVPYIDVKNEGNRLVIKWEKDKNKSINNVKSDMYITFKNLDEINLQHVGKFISSNTLSAKELDIKVNSVGETTLDMNCDKLKINHNGVGSVNLKGKATTATLDCSGVGGLKAFDLIVENLKLQSSGVGSAEVTARKEISITASGVGSVRYRGDAKAVQLNTSGIGKVRKVS